MMTTKQTTANGSTHHVTGVTIHHSDGRTDTYPDATAALAAGLATRFSLPLEPVEQVLAILEALSARKAAMDEARVMVLAGDRDDMRPQAAVVAAAGDYRALANALEELSNEIR